MNSPSIAILTGPGARHAYFTRKLWETFSVQLTLIESLNYPSPPANTKEEQEAWDWFFKRRDGYEKKAFGPTVKNVKKPLEGDVHFCRDSINDSQNIELLNNVQPDAIAVFGTGLLGTDMLSHFGDRIFNFHPGLTWTHRGSSCNFWPVLENRLDCLGATIIKINRGIDTGEIFDWGTIQVEPDDDEQSLIGKTILLGTYLMIRVLKSWLEGKAAPKEKKGDGRLYLMKDFTPAATLKLKNLVDSGELAHNILKASGK